MPVCRLRDCFFTVAMITAHPLLNPLISVHTAKLCSFKLWVFLFCLRNFNGERWQSSALQWKHINHLPTLKQMNGSWLLLYSASLFLLSNEPYISCRAVPFDWCLKVMWHYYGPANHRENTPIHCCSEWSAPTCVFTGLWRPGESFLSQGGNSSSVAQPCCCSLGLLSQSNPPTTNRMAGMCIRSCRSLSASGVMLNHRNGLSLWAMQCPSLHWHPPHCEAPAHMDKHTYILIPTVHT